LYTCISEKSESAQKLSGMEQQFRTKETQALFDNLKKISARGFLFGHQDDLAYGIEWTGGNFNSDVQKVCGDYPAVFGWDIGHIDSTFNIDGVPFADMKKWMLEVFEHGGINTVSWHQRNPLTGLSSWDTARVVNQLLPGGPLNGLFNSQLDKVAGFFNSLVTKDCVKVPVIFRPYHEHNGDWFWWGASSCSDEEYKAFFRYTVNYLRKAKNTDNVLMCYSTDAFNDPEDYLERYPGDSYVDILGFDDYKSIRSVESRDVFVKRLKTVSNLALEKDKAAVFSETGYESISMNDWWTKVLLDGIKAADVQVAYVLVWRNANKKHHFAPYPGHPSSQSFLTFVADPMTFFLNEIPEMYN
jgi:mannan endo-1,4-beta-mannosidase